MLYTQAKDHQPSGSRETVLKSLPRMGVAAILVIWPVPFEQTFISTS